MEVRFIFFSISHIYIIIHCYGFYFNLIGHIEVQFLIRLYLKFSRLQTKISYYILTIIHLLEFESAFEVISIGHFEFQLMTMFYYSILRLRLENVFTLLFIVMAFISIL